MQIAAYKYNRHHINLMLIYNMKGTQEFVFLL